MKHKKEISAGGIVYRDVDGARLWLITQHSQHKGWCFPKGHVGDEDENETVETAALREVREEGGVVTKIVDEVPIVIEYSYRSGIDVVDKKVSFFLMEYVSGDPKDHDWEVSEAKFISKSEVMKTLTYDDEKKAFDQILKLKSMV